MILRLCALACLWLCVGVHARSTVSILSPASVKSQVPAAIDHRPAVFGNPPYGSFRSAVLWYPKDPSNQYGCKPLNLDVEPDFPRSLSPIPIIMVNRSEPTAAPENKCSFVTKVRNVMSHAIAVVIVNYDDDNMPYMVDDGSYPPVPTPAVLIGKTVGNRLTAAMRPTTSGFTRISMQIGWMLPSVNGAVSWQLWTYAFDSGATSFKSMFGSADALLHMDTSFEPKYLFVAGAAMPDPCAGLEPGEPTPAECATLCVKDGKYCLLDPDGDGWLTGSDVVKENVWQMCLWKQLNEAAGIDPNNMQQHMIKNKWWSYVSLSESQCDTSEEFENNNCRIDVLRQVGLTDDSKWLDPIVSCYDSCLGPASPPSCDMIDEALKERFDKGIFYQLNTPTLVVNDEAVRGALSCNRPLETRSCQALADICQGYNSTFRPNVTVCVAPPTGCDFGIPKDCGGVCKPSTGGYINGLDACGSCLPVSDKDSWDKSCTDCAGLVNGPNTLDKCGLCLLPTDPKRDKQCLDCHDVIWGNATKDCAGKCGGGAKFDECGACIRVDQISSWNKSCTDCLGVFHGSAKLDACNVCNGDGKSCESTITSGSTNWGAVIAIVLAVAGVVGGAIYLYMKRQQNRMREDIDGILKQYLPLQDNTGAGHIRPTERLSGNDNL